MTTKTKKHRKPTELYPGHAKELKEKQEREQRYRSAAADPLPGVLAEAFALNGRPVGGLTVRKVVHYDFAILKMIKSPVLQQLERNDGGVTPYTDEQGYEIIYLFTRPLKEITAWLATQSASEMPKNFRKLAMEAIGFQLGPVEVPLLILEIGAQLAAAFATALEYSVKDQGGGPSSFPNPPAGTAPVGG